MTIIAPQHGSNETTTEILSPPSSPSMVPTEPSSPPTNPTTRQKVLGTILAILMNCLWVASGELQQYIYSEKGMSYPKPFMISFISQLFFPTYLLGFFKQSWREIWNMKDHSELPNLNSGTSSNPVQYPVSYVFRVAAILAPIYVVSGWAYNWSVLFTSMASASILSTLVSLFTLAMGALSGVEDFSFLKLAASLVSIAGVAMIVGVDERNATEASNPLLGDILCLLGVPLSSAFVVVVKARAGPVGAIKMPMLFGFLGVVGTLFAFPNLVIFDRLQVELFEIPSWPTFALLVLNAFIGAVLPTLLYGLTVVLTTPLTSSLAVALMVPMSMTWDWLKGAKKFTIPYFIGASLVIAGYLLVNIPVGGDSTGDQTDYEPLHREEEADYDDGT